jgi:ParB-like chromosome segregation protein Spo0J
MASPAAPAAAPWAAGAIEQRPVASLIPCATNARTHPPEQLRQLVAAIAEYGFVNPVIVDETGEIIAGHGRVMAASAMGMEAVPVIVRAGLTDAQKRGLRLADNKIALNSGWDEALLAQELHALRAEGVEAILTGFGDAEIDLLLRAVRTDFDEAPSPADGTPAEADSAAKPAAKAAAKGVREVDVSGSRFWVSIEGPFEAQADVLAALKGIAAMPGVKVASSLRGYA